MKILVSILLSMVLGVLSNRQPKEIAQRRQISYSNNIIHEQPGYPDQSAQSSVKVNFNQIEQKPIYPYVLQQQHQQQQQQQQQQKIVQEYTPTEPPQSQLFNVGYSVSFTNRQTAPPPKYTRTLDDGEIITGTRKFNEEVRGPAVNLSPQDYVTTALIGSKKQKISGIKPKPHYISSYPNPKTLLTQANLSPTTQKYYKVIEQTKPQIQNVQDLQQRYSWRNLSPGVEIIRSTEVPAVSQKFTRSEQLQFDHAKALGRSQDFDYTNAVDGGNAQPQQVYYKTQPQITRLPNNVQALPIDTSLLREPVRVDARYIEEAMRNQLLFANNKYAPQENNYGYRTIPVQEKAENQLVYQQEQPQAFPDYQSNRYQYKIYGKPQPLSGNFNEQAGEQSRQPRYLSELNTNLRPPPFTTVTYQRRIHVG